MSLFIASLNSGSNGNCYYIGNSSEAVLVDAGISCRETERRMRRLGLHMDNVKAVFISHEHIDHIKGLEVLAHRYQLPVYITPPTLSNGRLRLQQHLVRTFAAHEAVSVGSMQVTGFPKFHDAADPYSFIVSGEGINVGVFTDLGVACEHLVAYFSRCHAAFLEANYDTEMLENGPYPYHLKRRISGGNGHLSNRQALELFLKHRPAHMSHLLLAHLSKNNNRPELVSELFSPYAKELNVVIASRFNETDIYEVTGAIAVQENTAPKKVVQATLF